jgi:hypothetical protein
MKDEEIEVSLEQNETLEAVEAAFGEETEEEPGELHIEWAGFI